MSRSQNSTTVYDLAPVDVLGSSIGSTAHSPARVRLSQALSGHEIRYQTKIAA